MPERIGRYTINFPARPSIAGYASVVGKKESEGPLSHEFDAIYTDTTMGEKSWEKAENALIKSAVQMAADKSGYTMDEMDVIFGGDLLNQSVGCSFGLRDFTVPFMGLFGACSTMALSLIMAGVYVDSGAAGRAIAATCSHFCSAERQFRLPLEYGGQRPPSAQWTVTGSGAAVVSGEDKGGPYLIKATPGKIMDLGIKDANNMGAAMAPAAADTIKTFLHDTRTTPSDYDMILTGDLGEIGTRLLHEILERENILLGEVHKDCGLLIFDNKRQDVGSGGSGCACSATVLCGYIFNRMKKGELSNILFCATGALMSTTSSQQGESIPSVAHLVQLQMQKNG